MRDGDVNHYTISDLLVLLCGKRPHVAATYHVPAVYSDIVRVVKRQVYRMSVTLI